MAMDMNYINTYDMRANKWVKNMTEAELKKYGYAKVTKRSTSNSNTNNNNKNQ